MNPGVAVVIGCIFALVATVLAFLYIMPEKKRKNLNPFFQKIADILNFKQLLIEKVLKALYVFNTFAVIFGGFFMLFSGNRNYYYDSFQSLALYGLLMMILGPIVVRLTYEGLMLFILLVKNTIEINKKLSAPEQAEPQKAESDSFGLEG